MKVIDLLNKIANDEEVPRKVKYKTYYWEYEQDYKDYKDNDNDYVFSCSNYDISNMLNNEVEILEEPKGIPEKINNGYYHLEQDEQNQLFKNKINEIIDYLESKGKSND